MSLNTRKGRPLKWEVPNETRESPDGKLTYIRLDADHEAVIDTDQYHHVAPFRWERRPKNYVWSQYLSGKPIALHTLIMDPDEGEEVDHINHDPLDNRRINLRTCSRTENQRNKRKTNSLTASKYKGVSWNDRYKRWYVRIWLSPQKAISLGTYKEEKDAARAYNEAARKYFGEFACLNDVDA